MHTNKKWVESEVEQLLAMKARKWTARRIAKELDRPLASVEGKIYSLSGFNFKTRPPLSKSEFKRRWAEFDDRKNKLNEECQELAV